MKYIFILAFFIIPISSESDFFCDKGKKFIPIYEFCDGKRDCIDGKDESNCGPNKKCILYQFKCESDYKCIPSSFHCDGTRDCKDGSDEKGCPGYTEILTTSTTTSSTSTPSSTIPRQRKRKKCVLPQYPHKGQYVVNQNPDLTPGSKVNSNTLLNYTCDSNYTVSNPISICLTDGTWNNQPECLRICVLPKSTTVKFKCTKDGVDRNCSDLVESGTVVDPECVQNHRMQGLKRRIKCVRGYWTGQIPRCVADCGLQPAIGVGLVLGGKEAKPGELPWHLGVYSYLAATQDDPDTPIQICGATILARKVAISAAHCFWNVQKNELYPASLYAVAAGKTYRDYNNADDKEFSFVQFSDVKEILIPNEYSGNELQQQSDVALLVLEELLDFSNSISPACLELHDFTFDRDQITNGALGKSAGWGVTSEGGTSSPVLKTVDLPVVDFNNCKAKMPPEWQRYLTNDKFCAGYLNGTGMCSGDSGGGLVFNSTERGHVRWYLRGIVSVGVPSSTGDTCRKDTYSGFTHVFKHSNWILENLEIYVR